LHAPFDSLAGLDYETLASEGQVVLLPSGHPLTGRAAVSMEEVSDLPGLPQPRWPAPDGSYADGPGPEVRDHAQLLQLVALGRTSVIAPESVRANLRNDVIALPVVDAPQVTTVIAWPPHSRSKPVADLVRTATRL
jgi:DNA-binding transcriptional LysR family regulator